MRSYIHCRAKRNRVVGQLNSPGCRRDGYEILSVYALVFARILVILLSSVPDKWNGQSNRTYVVSNFVS